MSYDAFKSSIRLIAQVSEPTLAFNTWIVSPATDPGCRLRGTWLGPTSRSITYAISEPLYTYFLARMSFNGELACLLILVSGIHLMLSVQFWMTLDKRVEDLRFVSSPAETQALQVEVPDKQLASTKEGHCIDSFTATAVQNLDPRAFYSYAFAHLQLAAAGNAALLFVAQKLDVINIDSFALHLFALGAALFYFSLSRLGEWYFARSVGLPLFYGSGRTMGSTAKQLGYLFFLTVVRSGVRWLVGLRAGFVSAWVDDAADVSKFSGDMGIGDALRRLPYWFLPCMFLLSLGLSYASGMYSGRLRARERRTE